jgi:hypothetical protein
VLNAGIVDENIEPAGPCERCRDHFGNRFRLRHIGRREARFDAKLGDNLFARPPDLVRDAQPVEYDLGTGRSERPYNAKADTAGRARDQRDLAGEHPLRIRILRFDGNIHGPNPPMVTIGPRANPRVWPTLRDRRVLGKCPLASETIRTRYCARDVIPERDQLSLRPILPGSQSMEMHQVRYFLAVAQLLNVTRAAENCNVTQPSLTRAFKQLEAEFGGDLFRRERPTQMTELGQRMHPLLKQCYEAAIGARSLASSVKSGALRIALTHSVDLSLLIPFLTEVKRQFNRLEFNFLRGNSREVGEMLKKGEAELGVAAEIGQEWDRLDTWPLFTENFRLVVSRQHRLAERDNVELEDLRAEQLLS